MSNSEPTRFKPASSPEPGRTYVRSKAKRVERFVGAALLLLGGSFVLGSALLDGDRTKPWEILGAGGALMLLWGCLFYLHTRRFRLILHPDRLIICGLRDRAILRSQVTGYRIDGRGQFGLIGPKDRVLGSFELTVDLDHHFDEWLAGVPNLDQQAD